MREFTFNCVVHGQLYTADQLAELRYRRHLHVLHDMKRLGVDIRHHGTTLSDDDINLLGSDDAHRVSTATRESLTVTELTDLYAEQIRDSDRMWKKANITADAGQLRAAITEVTVANLTIDEIRTGLAGSANYAQLNPDHYFLESGPASVHLMETFGMFGGPTAMYITADPTISVPAAIRPGYSVLTAGYATLASDGADVNLRAHHQIKSLADGFDLRLGAYFPPATPSDLVNGHSLHMAIEFLSTCELLAATLAP
jgi:hypothetical protein